MTSCHKKCLISSSNPAQVEMPLFEMMFWNITSWHENASHNSGPLLGDISGGFPSQLPVMWSCGVFFIASLNNPFYKESSCRWFETPCRLCDATVISYACNIQDPCHNFPRAKCVKAMERGVTSCVVVWRHRLTHVPDVYAGAHDMASQKWPATFRQYGSVIIGSFSNDMY